MIKLVSLLSVVLLSAQVALANDNIVPQLQDELEAFTQSAELDKEDRQSYPACKPLLVLDNIPDRAMNIPTKDFENNIEEQYGETPYVAGLQSQRALLQIYLNEEKDSWTMSLAGAQGNSLMLASGVEFYVDESGMDDGVLSFRGVVMQTNRATGEKSLSYGVKVFLDLETEQWELFRYSNEGNCKMGEGTDLFYEVKVPGVDV